MKSTRSKALSLGLTEVLDPEFVREVLDRKVAKDDTPRAMLLRSSTSITLVRKKVLSTFAQKTGRERLSVLASLTPSEVKGMAKLGTRTLRWLEEYLHLLGVVLPRTRSVHGMSPAAREFLESL